MHFEKVGSFACVRPAPITLWRGRKSPKKPPTFSLTPSFTHDVHDRRALNSAQPSAFAASAAIAMNDFATLFTNQDSFSRDLLTFCADMGLLEATPSAGLFDVADLGLEVRAWGKKECSDCPAVRRALVLPLLLCHLLLLPLLVPAAISSVPAEVAQSVS